MTIYEKATKPKDKDFKQIIGVQKATFDEMILEKGIPELIGTRISSEIETLESFT